MKIKLLISLILSVFLISCDGPRTESEADPTATATPEPTPKYFPITVAYPNADALIMAGTTFKYTINGGLPPYSFSLISGPGNIESDGTFSAGDISGNSVLDIKDQSGQTLRVRVRVNPLLKVEPSEAKILVGSTQTFLMSGGVPPYSFYIQNGAGFLDALGTYQATSTPGTASIKVFDSQGNSVTATATSNHALKINPSSLDLNRGDTFLFTADAGFPPYSYTVIGGGVMNGVTGSLIAPPTAQNIIVQVKDSVNNISQSSVVINNRPLTINLPNVVMEIDKSITFKGDGGLAPYSYHLISTGDNSGQLLPSGIYYAPHNPSVNVVEVRDSEGNSAVANITINSKLTVFPSPLTTVPGRSELIYATGGVPPYSFQIISGAGTISNSTNNDRGIFIAPNTAGTTVVQLRDSNNTTVSTTINIDPELQISPTSPKISVGNQMLFVASGGVPPYEIDIFSGSQYGSIDSSGLFTANTDALLNNVSVVIRLRDSVTAANSQAKFTTLTITPKLAFSENAINVTSGTEKIITAIGGVSPYTLRFKTGSSLIGSSILNVPDGSGGYTMKYIAGFVSDDVVEKLEIIDSLGNKVDQLVTVNGGLVSFTDPRKGILSSETPLANASMRLETNSDLATITSVAHGLANGAFIKLNSTSACANIDDFELSKQYTITYVDADTFIIKLVKKSNDTVICGNGSDLSYQKLTSLSSTVCPANTLLNILNLRDYSTGLIQTKCQVSSIPYSSSYSSLLMNRTNNNHLQYNLSLSSDPNGYTTVEMWFKWNGDRSPNTNPATVGFNGTLVGFDNYNVSFITVKNSTNTANRSLCFNTTSSLDCYGANIDALVANRWTHYTFLFHNSNVNSNKIYINGAERALNKQGTFDPVPRVVSSIFKIGANINGSSTYHQVGGEMGLIRIYNKSLSPSEVFNNYNEFKQVYQP